MISDAVKHMILSLVGIFHYLGFQIPLRGTNRFIDHSPHSLTTKSNRHVRSNQPCLALDACCDASLLVAACIFSVCQWDRIVGEHTVF